MIELALNSLLNEMHKGANAQLELLINQLLKQVLYPSPPDLGCAECGVDGEIEYCICTTPPPTVCRKHSDIRSTYISVLRLQAKYKKLYQERYISIYQLGQFEKYWLTAQEAYRNALCTCDGLEMVANKPLQPAKFSASYGNLPLSFDVGSGW